MAKKITKVGRYRVEDASRPYTPGQDLTLGELAGYQRRAARVILQSVPNVEPEVLRYARKVMGLTQAQLARAIDYTPEQISRWENGENPFSRAVQLAVAAVLDILERDGQLPGDVSVSVEGTVTLKAS